jgi:hypothetical protein
MADTVAWMKRSQNGSLGEARARSFLLERFWVLERSIDKDGADYLIQRRLTEDNFLSREPPRLGVVQVKFIQDEGTAVYLVPEYVCDKDGRSHTEFFLLLHTGSEDRQRQFLISAKQITEDFEISTLGSGKKKYYLPGSAILKDSKYEVINKGRALDTIEHALRNANFMRNRAYFGASQYVKVEKHYIDSDFLLPIDNGYCHIDKEFYEEKKKLQNTLFDLEEVTEAIGKILRSTDPIEAYGIFEESIQQYIGSGGYGTKLSFSADFFRDNEFVAAAANHKERLKKIRELNIEHDYLQLLDEFEKKVLDWVLKTEVWKSEFILKVTSNYDQSYLRNLWLEFEVSEPSTNKFPAIVRSSLGHHVILFKPASLKNTWNNRNDFTPEEIVSKNSWQIRRTFQREVDTYLLGEDLVSPWM